MKRLLLFVDWLAPRRTWPREAGKARVPFAETRPRPDSSLHSRIRREIFAKSRDEMVNASPKVLLP
jgi:hypothetical protein